MVIPEAAKLLHPHRYGDARDARVRQGQQGVARQGFRLCRRPMIAAGYRLLDRQSQIIAPEIIGKHLQGFLLDLELRMIRSREILLRPVPKMQAVGRPCGQMPDIRDLERLRRARHDRGMNRLPPVHQCRLRDRFDGFRHQGIEFLGPAEFRQLRIIGIDVTP